VQLDGGLHDPAPGLALALGHRLQAVLAWHFVWFGGVGAQFKLFGEHTRKAFSLIVQPVEPGRMAPPHVHWGEDEFSCVLEGELGARVGDQEVVATAGSIILKPKGVPHCFWNSTSKPAKFIEIISPPASIPQGLTVWATVGCQHSTGYRNMRSIYVSRLRRGSQPRTE
jgi:mannose-6-phosphate isomerase-like protein (cupin superfamily)